MLAIVLGGAFRSEMLRALNLNLTELNRPRFDAFLNVAELHDGHQVDGVLQWAQVAHPPQAWIHHPGRFKRSSEASGFRMQAESSTVRFRVWGLSL